MRLLDSWRQLPPDEPSRSHHQLARRRAEGRLGPDRIAQLVADYRAGIPTTQLTRTYGLGKGSVLRLLDAHGVARRRQGLTPVELQRAAQLYRHGWSLVRIGRQLGQHHTVIARALALAGVRQQRGR